MDSMIGQRGVAQGSGKKIIQLWFPLYSIIEWWRNNFPEIKKDPERKESDKACGWIGCEKSIENEHLCPFLLHKLRWIKQRSDIVVLSQSAKHYSFSGSQTEYFIREKVKCLYVMKWLSSSSSLPCLSQGWRKVFAFKKGKRIELKMMCIFEKKLYVIVNSYV